MGFGSIGNRMTYAATALSRQDAVVVGARRMLENPQPGQQIGHPMIAVDCNNVINIVGRNSIDVVSGVAAFLVGWALYGAVILPICDGRNRPKSKQASNKNRANRERNKARAIVGRQELRGTINQLENEPMDARGREKLVTKRSKLERDIKTAETQSINVVPPNFPELLEDELIRIGAHNNYCKDGQISGRPSHHASTTDWQMSTGYDN